MILIEEISPISLKSKVSIESIKVDFYNRVNYKGDYSPRDKLISVLRGNSEFNYTISTPVEQDILEYILGNFYSIILSLPSGLDDIREHFITQNWHIVIFDPTLKKATDFGEFIKECFGYKERFRSRVRKGIWLAGKLNIKSCPYCNAQYTLIVNSKDKGGIAKFQFDHFFPKSEFPYFSLSLYNLIPSCASCNNQKSSTYLDIDNHYHPYHNELNTFSKFHIDYSKDVKTMSYKELRELDENDLIVQFVHKFEELEDFVKNHELQFDIEAIYSRHKDIAKEIILKAKIYDLFYRRSTMQIKGLFPDESLLLKYLLGVDIKDEEILNRPLTKFIIDISKQCELFP
jgi:5-methylcytosine-specific restriction endonuclease McrA